MIEKKLIVGFINIAGTTFVPAIAIKITFEVNAVISNERNTI